MPSQKTWTGKVGDTKNFTITTEPADATDAQEVLQNVTATSTDEAVVTVTKKSDGSFDEVIVGEGTATVKYTSGELTASTGITGNPPS